MDWREFLFWMAIMAVAVLVTFGPELFRHRHKDYKRQTTFRTITERETYERWDDKTPVVSETRERVQNADWVRVEKPTKEKTSPSEKVRSMMGKTDMLVVIVTATLLLMTFFFVSAAVWGIGQILGGLAV